MSNAPDLFYIFNELDSKGRRQQQVTAVRADMISDVRIHAEEGVEHNLQLTTRWGDRFVAAHAEWKEFEEAQRKLLEGPSAKFSPLAMIKISDAWVVQLKDVLAVSPAVGFEEKHGAVTALAGFTRDEETVSEPGSKVKRTLLTQGVKTQSLTGHLGSQLDTSNEIIRKMYFSGDIRMEMLGHAKLVL